jgi:hypothetical protein
VIVAIVALFGVLLPLSLWGFAVGILAAGFLRDPADQNRLFDIAARSSGRLPDGPSCDLHGRC